MAGQIGHARAVAPLVVVPGVNLELGAVHHHRGEAIHDGAAVVVHVVDRHQGPLLVAEDPAQLTGGGGLEGAVHLLHRHGALELEYRIGERSIEQRHTHGVAVELALQLRKDQPNRLGRTGGGGDQALGAGAGAAQVALEAIHHHLGVGHVVEGGDGAVADAKALVHHLHHRRQAVGGARGGGEQPVARRIEELVVDAEHHVQRLLAGHHTLHRAGHDHALQAHLIEVGLQGFGSFELAAALQHQLHAHLVPGHGSGIALLGVTHRRGVHHKACGVGLHGLMPAAVHRVEGEQVGGGVGVTGRVIHMHQLDAGAPPQGPEHQAADATEAVDADFHGQCSAGKGRREPAAT